MVVFALHKTKGLVVEQGSAPTHGQGGRKRTLNDILLELSEAHSPDGRLFAVGRLDKDTTGLLLIKNTYFFTTLIMPKPGGFSI